jgi:hypothetical protein
LTPSVTDSVSKNISDHDAELSSAETGKRLLPKSF